MTNREEMARREGMSYALDFAKKNGIDALEKELEMRGATHIPIRVSQSDLNKVITIIKNQMSEALILMACYALHDEFDMGEAELHRFVNRFNTKLESVNDDYCSWSDVQTLMREEVGTQYHITTKSEVVNI